MQPFSSETQAADVAIVGAGVVGIATAWALARRGVRVLLLERGEGPALETSYANGAQLSYAYTDAMAGPALWKQLPSMVSGSDRAFHTRASLDPHYWLWGLQFLRNATHARFQRNTLATLKLALESKAAMDALLQQHPIEFHHRVAGKLHVYYDATALPKAQATIDAKRPFGICQQIISANEAITIEPALAGARGIAGVVYSPDEEAGDPWLFSSALLALLHEHYGVQVRFGFNLQHIQRSGKHWQLSTSNGDVVQAQQLAICAGINSHALLRKLGIASPLMPVKGYSITAPLGANAPSASITDTARKLVFCRLGDSIRIAGLADLNHWNAEPDPDRLAQLIAMAKESLPEAADYAHIQSHWAGLRPVTPQSTPEIRLAREGLVLNIGHGMLGWTLAMGSAERAAALLQGGS